MTIHDILVNCGSVSAETPITIRELSRIKEVCLFKDLEPKYEMLQIKFFTVGNWYTNKNYINVIPFVFYI